MKEEIYPKKMVEEYDDVLITYPELYKLRETTAETIKQYLKGKSEIILEIGSGTGETTEYILKATNAKIIAVDIEQKMIQRLKQKPFFNKKRIFPVCEDATQHIKQYTDNAFTCTTSSWTIHNFTKETRNVLLKEIYRTLKPGGIFVNMDKYVLDDPIAEEESFKAIVKQARKLEKIDKGKIAEISIKHEEDDRAPQYIMREQESIKFMRELGFIDIKILNRVNREAVLYAKKP